MRTLRSLLQIFALPEIRALVRASTVGLTSLTAALGVLAYHPGWPSPPPERAPRLPSLTWGITVRPEAMEAAGMPLERQLDEAQGLGVGLLRFDVRWTTFESEEGKLRPEAIAWYRRFIALARARGMQIKVNLGGYPGWALDRLSKHPDDFFAAYHRYCVAVARTLGRDVDYFQLGNEFNTILDPIPRQWDGRVFREARASLDEAKVDFPGWAPRTVINVCDTFYLPYHDHLEQTLDEASDSVDVVGYDFYGGNYSHLTDWAAWPGIAYLSEIMRRYHKDGAICETGCPDLLGWGRQERWAQEAEPALLRAIAASPVRDRFRFVAFYELYDEPSLPFPMPHSEATFGLLTVGGQHKPAYDALRSVIASTREAQASASR